MWVVVGVYAAMTLATAVIARPALKMACEAATPIGVGESVVIGVIWPVTLPGLIRSIRYPEK
jgi:hypothetical protein